MVQALVGARPLVAAGGGDEELAALALDGEALESEHAGWRQVLGHDRSSDAQCQRP